MVLQVQAGEDTTSCFSDRLGIMYFSCVPCATI